MLRNSSESRPKKGSGKSSSLKGTSASHLRPSFGMAPPMGILPLSASVMKNPKGLPPGAFPFPNLPFTAMKGKGPMPTFKVLT